VSKIYRRNNPLCEVSKALGRTVAADVVDHLIRIVDENGARYDENNFMSMCHYWHNVKSGKESHGSLNLPYELNILERKIPKNKMDIIKILVPDYKKEENHIREGGLNLK
jgi:5-methylcytosine-specific restriction endonuclease McrA